MGLYDSLYIKNALITPVCYVMDYILFRLVLYPTANSEKVMAMQYLFALHRSEHEMHLTFDQETFSVNSNR